MPSPIHRLLLYMILLVATPLAIVVTSAEESGVAAKEGAGDAGIELVAGTSLIRLSGSLPLRSPISILSPGSREQNLHQACELVRRAIRSGRGRIALDLSGDFAPGPAAAEELAAVLRTRPEGMEAHCLLDMNDDAALIVAAACDRVCAAEAGALLINGTALAVDYYAAALEKIGIEVHAVVSGPEKTAPEPFTAAEPSPAAQKELRTLLAGIDSVLLTASRRDGLDMDRLKAARAQAPQTGPQAVELGLVDAAVEPGDWEAELPSPVERLRSGPDLPDLSSLAGIMQFWSLLLKGRQQPRYERVVAVVELEGMILDGSGGTPGSVITGTDTARLIDELAADERIKVVVVRINSGGGSASASDRIHAALQRLDAVKPVIALLDGVAASGGYYIGCGAREILVHRSTITGSIGVFGMLPDITGAKRKLGINTFRIRSDPRADLFSGPWDQEKREALTAMIEAVDRRFQGVVAEARGLEPGTVAELADGKVYLGEIAVELGLADGIATLAEAVARARHLAGIEDRLPLELYPREQSLAAMLGVLQVRSLVTALGLPPGWARLCERLRTGRPLAMAWHPALRLR